ncbi:ac72 [Oxyplax ochracea nucleopolyhedrovirus]|uniref:Ac72 n=1 Tax=Oxyplax ochracea nucleopolyhedrovirus TaxID=2083176 RepID=A0A2L0WU46_9ABAC|nr:ac72 [Oxyplax ochracea nucleopolyhedrovirus]AVA31165.1 ac72 [Oxyplax ochracea nucleopolyhedrovirus]
MSKKILTFFTIHIFKNASKKLVCLLCHCLMSCLDDKEKEVQTRHYQLYNNCNIVYINVVVVN